MAEEHNALKYGPSLSTAGSIAAGGGYGDVGISRLSETLGPTINLWERTDWELLRGEILFARFVTSAAVAARFSGHEIVNALGSGKLVVIRAIDVLSSVEVDAQIDNGGSIAANPVVTRGVALDGRYPQLGETSIVTITSGDFAAGANLPQQRLSTGTSAQRPLCPWLLPPGRKLFLLGTAVLRAVHVNLFWSERSPFPGELQARG